MKRNPFYFLKKVGNNMYLLPYGQAIELHAHAICVNEVTAFLWEELGRSSDIEVLTARLIEKYNVFSEEYDSIEKDVKSVLHDLQIRGIVLREDSVNERLQVNMLPLDRTSVYEETATDSTGAGTMDKRLEMSKSDGDRAERNRIDYPRSDVIKKTLEIAGITICYYGKTGYFSEKFESFYKKTEESEPDISIFVIENEPSGSKNLRNVLQGGNITVQKDGDYYVMKSRETPVIREAVISETGNEAVIYMNTEAEYVNLDAFVSYGLGKLPDYIRNMTLADIVFHVIRHPFLLNAQQRNMYVIHSASILYNGKAWLFSALSGTGKSTHTDIWHKLYGTTYLNGDLNLLALENGELVVKGIPWCGTSGIYTTKRYPVGGIILLARDSENWIEDLSLEEKILGIWMRFISPKWNERQASDSLDFADRIVRKTKVARLHCNMEDEAAKVCRAWIDRIESS